MLVQNYNNICLTATVQTTPRPTFNQGNGIVDDAGEENGAITPSPGNNCPESKWTLQVYSKEYFEY